jgi:hypothetical protein
MTKFWLFGFSHLLTAILGFAAGIYLLPILVAPQPPSDSDVASAFDQGQFSGQFHRGLEGSDFLHWGEGTVSVGPRLISLKGQLAPGPDYKLYLSPEFVETEADFERVKPKMVRIGDIRTFENFVVTVPESVDPGRFNTVIVWCESFGQFITAARYQ